MKSQTIQKRVTYALALIHAALEEPSDENVAIARSCIAEWLPEARRLTSRIARLPELRDEIMHLTAALALLQRRLDGRPDALTN